MLWLSCYWCKWQLQIRWAKTEFYGTLLAIRLCRSDWFETELELYVQPQCKYHFLDLITEVESRTQGTWPRPRTQKNSEAKTDFPRTDPLEAEDRMLEAKDQGHNEQVLSEKKRSSRRKLQIFQEILDEEKKRSYSWPIFNKSKNSALLGRGQGIFLGLVGF